MKLFICEKIIWYGGIGILNIFAPEVLVPLETVISIILGVIKIFYHVLKF